MKVPILFLTSFLFCFALAAQNGTGALIDDQLFKKVKRLKEYTGAKTRRSIPRYSLRKFCPIPQNQRQSNTCVGWATGYGALSIIDAIHTKNFNADSITKNAFSASFIFNQIKTPDCKGALITDAFQLLKEKGDCRFTTFNDDPLDCDQPPTPVALEEAAQTKVKDYAAIFYADDLGNTKIKKTVQALLNDNPVILIAQVTRSFRDIALGQTVWSPKPNEAPLTEAHAMVVTGFNKRTRQFELMNSWGPNWGDRGFIWVSFEDFSRLALYGFVLIPDFGNRPAQSSSNFAHREQNSMSGTFYLCSDSSQSHQTVASYSFREKVIFDAEKQLYHLVSSDPRVFDGYKLTANNITKGIYLYLFSLNPKGEVAYLYPLPQDRTTGLPLAHFIPGDSLDIQYPPDDDWLELEMPGTDYLGVLISWRAIDKVEQKIQQLSPLAGTLPERLKTVFKDQLADPSEVIYELDKMAFKTNFPLTTKNKIVPLILAIRVRE